MLARTRTHRCSLCAVCVMLIALLKLGCFPHLCRIFRKPSVRLSYKRSTGAAGHAYQQQLHASGHFLHFEARAGFSRFVHQDLILPRWNQTISSAVGTYAGEYQWQIAIGNDGKLSCNGCVHELQLSSHNIILIKCTTASLHWCSPHEASSLPSLLPAKDPTSICSPHASQPASHPESAPTL